MKKVLRFLTLAAMLCIPWVTQAQSFTWDFESDNGDWNFANPTSGNSWVIGTAQHNGSGENSLYVSNDNGTTAAYSGSNTVIYAWRDFTITSAGTYDYSFDWQCTGESTWDFMRVYIVPEANFVTLTEQSSSYSSLRQSGAGPTITGGTAIDGGSRLNTARDLGTGWHSQAGTIALSAGTYRFLVIWLNDGSGNNPPSGCIDNIVFDLPSCPRPTGVAASNVSATGATLTWNVGSEEDWVLQYGTDENFADYTEVNVSTTPSQAISGLTAQTTYYVRVMADCGGGDESDWSTIYSFTTPCAAITAFPWTEDFNSLTTANTIPDCWNNEDGTTTDASYKWCYNTSTSGNGATNGTSHDGTKCVRFNSFSNGSNKTNFLKTPPISLPAETMQLTFWYKNPTGGDFSVYISTDGGSTYTTSLVTGLTSVSSWTESEAISLSAYANQEVVIVFKGTSNWGSGDAYIYLDDVTVSEVPSCIKPTDVTCSATTTTSATIGWTQAGSSATAWQICINDDEANLIDASTNPFTVTGLTHSTVYTAKVRAICGGGYSDWSTSVANFATECDARVALGYTQNFDALTAGDNVLPLCWSYINTTTYSYYQGYPRAYADGYSNYSHSAPNCLYFYSYAYYSGGSTTYDPQPQYAILPQMTGLSGKQVTLWAKGSYSSSTFKIGTMSDPTDASTFEPFEITSGVYEQALTTSYQEFEYVVPTTTDAYLAIMIDGASSDRTSNGVYIDDISIANPPTCLKPSGLTSTRTAHTATLSWTNGANDQTAWQVAYSTSSTFAPAADFTPNGTTEWLVDAGTNPYTLTGLTPSTTYYAYIRANCDGGDYSAWCSTRVSFTTTSGTQAPTGLAATPESPYAATVTWTGVAANDNHASYDLFYSQNSTPSPNNETVPIFTGITAESYLIPGLLESTTYYVWVRDNCGADGYSDWSSRATFTTPVFCPAPTGVTVSSATAHGATISWTGTSDSYNVYVGKVTLNSDSYDFEDNAISPNFTNDATYPWTVTTDAANNGTYSIKSGNYNVGGSTSTIMLTVDLASEATLSFAARCSSEQTDPSYDWDYGTFYIDDVQQGDRFANSTTFSTRNYVLAAGSHTLKWTYKKDGSVNSNDDCFYVDDITITSLDVASWERYEDVASPYELFDDGNIDPETDYAVKVVGVCGGEESTHESAVVYFTTSAACDASNVAVDNISFHSADITWSGSSDAGYTVMRGHDEIAHEFVNETFTGSLPTTPEWTNDANHPWVIAGSYIRSGNAGKASTTSQISVTVDLDAAGYVEFEAECRGEGTSTYWDKCIFSIDGADQFTHGADITNYGFVHYKFAVTAGTHTFTWKYSKDSSTDPAGDYFAIDNVQIYTTNIDWEEVETVDVLHYTFDGLEDGTRYYVKVSPECDRTIESDIVNFTTPALPTISVKADKWYALSTPMHDAGQNYESVANVENLTTGTYDFLCYDEPSSTWQSQKTHFTTLEQGRGYIYRRSADAVLKVDGVPNTGNISVPVTKDVNGWNLIGNPFMTTIRLNSTYIDPSSTAALISGGYYKLNTNGTWTAIYTSTDIVAGQAVLVKASTEGDLILRPMASKSASAAEEESDKGIVFSVSNNEFTDVAYAMFADGEGLPKIAHLNPEAPALSIGGYAIATLDENTERFPMSVSGQGRYTLALKENSAATGYLHLIDRATGSDIDLLSTPEYTFFANGNADRFEVRLMPGMDVNGNVTFVRIDGSRLIIDGEGMLQVYDVMGRQLGSAQVSGTTTFDRSSLGIVSAGVYVMRLDGNSQKIVVK